MHASLSEDERARAAHQITQELVYGPTVSRRYGKTYGVNVLPAGSKLCDWNCTYCQLGYSRYGEDELEPEGPFPSPRAIQDAVEAAPLVADLAGIVVCGNGEPTLHPEFPEVIAALRLGRDHRFPGVPIVVLTNAAEAWRKRWREALRSVDEVAVKLDAGTCELFHKINMPLRSTCVEHQIRTVKRLEGCAIQSCFVTGRVDNSHDAAVEAWISAIARAMPKRVDVYTIGRPTPSGKLTPVPAERLQEIARRAESRTGIPVRVAAG